MPRSTRQIRGGEMITVAEPSAAVLAPPVFCADLGKSMLTDADICTLQARLVALAQHVSPGRITVRHVVNVTAEHFGTTANELISECREQLLCRHRQIAMFVARKVTRTSLLSIGRCIGDRDHSTILHGVRAVQRLIDSGDTYTVAAIVQIIERLTDKTHGRQVLIAAEQLAAMPAPMLADQDIDAQRNRLLALLTHISPSRITVRRVIKVTAQHFGTTVDDLIGASRRKSLCRHRQIVMFVARKVARRNLAFIGRGIGDRDRRTIKEGAQAVWSLIDAGHPGTIAAVVQIIERLTEQAR